MNIPAASNAIVALALLVIFGFGVTKVSRFFNLVGWRYRATMGSAVLFLFSTVIESVYSGLVRTHILDPDFDRPAAMVGVDVVQAVSVVVLAVLSIGYVDIVFFRRRQRDQLPRAFKRRSRR